MKLFGKEIKNFKEKEYFLGPLSVKEIKSKYVYRHRILFGFIRIDVRDSKKTIGLLFNLIKFQVVNTDYMLDTLEEIKKASITSQTLQISMDITKLPPATGVLRIVQLTSIRLLQIIDKICRKNKINYFIMYGTLLGAVRHNGFIPWDDDLDIGMLRKDFNRFREIFDKENTDIRVSNYYMSTSAVTVYKVILKVPNCQIDCCPFVDIFVYEPYYKIADENEKNSIIWEKCRTANKVLELRKIYDIANQQEDIKENLKLISKYSHDIICSGNSTEDLTKVSYYLSAEFPVQNGFICFDYDDVFPLVELDFEDGKFYAPRCYEKFLYMIYGDYMRPIIDSYLEHFTNKKFPYEQLEFMKDFINN